jgi:hypothetical protein
MTTPGRHVVYVELTPEEFARFEKLQRAEQCLTKSDLIRIALTELAEQYKIPDAFPLRPLGRPKKSA